MVAEPSDLFHFDPILDSLEKQRLLNGDLVNRAKFVIADWLVEKEGRAAQAAERATAAAEAVMRSANEQRRLESLSRIIQKPDMYKPETREQEIDQWMEWRHVMRNYLGVVDHQFLEELDVFEGNASNEVVLSTLNDGAKMRSRELYAILQSFVRNRPAKIVRNVGQSNGYEAWRLLMVEMQPKTRQRQLALMTQLNSMTFDPRKSLNEQLGKYEEVIRECERISGTTYPEDLKVSTLVSAAPSVLQVQLHMSLSSDTTYHDLKEKVLSYERSTTKWQAANGLQFPAVHQQEDGPVPMEIDKVTYPDGGKKGKKGDKGKTKKGKDKSKGKKGKMKDADGKANKPKGNCHTCGKPGHYSRECWWNTGGAGGAGSGKGGKDKNRKKVNQVQAEAQSSEATSSNPTATASSSTQAVRQIRLRTPPLTSTTEIFDISEEALFDLDQEYHINDLGGRGDGAPPNLLDAQKNPIATQANRKFDFWFKSKDGQEFAVREQCVVGNVKQPLLAVGKLLRKGWQLVHHGGTLTLQEPFGRGAPVGFKHNSLVAAGHIRSVQVVNALTEVPKSMPPTTPKLEKFPEEIQKLVGKMGMHSLPERGWKVHFESKATHLLDPRTWYDPDLYRARTTWMQTLKGLWIQVENSEDYSSEFRPYARICDEPRPRLTFVSMDSFGEGCFGGVGMPPKRSCRLENEIEVEDEVMEDALNAAETPLQEAPSSSSGRAEVRGHQQAATAKEVIQDMYLEEVAADKAERAAKESMARQPNMMPRSDPEPTEDEKKKHQVTHMPYASWCSACVKTRARGDKHSERKDQKHIPVIQVDFFFTVVDPEGRPLEGQQDEQTCSLVAADLDARMVLSVPGPNKGKQSLRKYVEDLVKFSIALHEDDGIILQSDGEPAIKAVVRVATEARAKMGRRTVQRTTPVQDHAANGAAERAVQTVRRLGNCLMEAVEEIHGKQPVGSDLRVWAQGHAAFLYNRFHVLQNFQKTPYELAFGGGAQWCTGIWAGVNPHNGAHHILTENGAIESNAVRVSAEQLDVAKFKGLPWETKAVVIKIKKRVAPPEPLMVEVGPKPLSSAEAGATPTGDADATHLGGAAAAQLGGATVARPDGPGDEAASDPPSSESEELMAERPQASSPSRSSKRRAEEDVEKLTEKLTEEVLDEISKDKDQVEFFKKLRKERMEREKGEKRKSEDAELAPRDLEGHIRQIQTVDSEWYDGDELWETENHDTDFYESDHDATYHKHNTLDRPKGDTPPEVDEETLNHLDDLAELQEIERLEKMSVLVDVCPEEDAEWLSTTFVKTWKAEAKGEDVTTWWRRARLVARQYRHFNEFEPEDTFSPASTSSLLRLLPVVAQTWHTPIWIIDVKEWYLFLNSDLKELGMEAMIEVPTLYRAVNKEERRAAQVHVDDAMVTGVEWNGSITVRPAAHFYNDIYELLERPKLRSTPGPAGGDMFAEDASEEMADGKLYRTIVGKLLYISGERPDAQVVIQYLAAKASRPTVTATKILKHLVGYLKATEGQGINLKCEKGESIMRDGDPESHSYQPHHLVEAVSDSNFANDRTTRKSLSSGHIYLNKCLMFSFVRGQKVVTLSSGEAELVALTQTVGESILVKKAWEFLTREETWHLARTDSSVARAIATRLGVGKVRHLQTSCLWLQQWIARKELRMAAIPTSKNPTDCGTKILPGSRLKYLSFIMNLVDGKSNRIGTEEHRKEAMTLSPNLIRAIQAVMAMSLQGCIGGNDDQMVDMWTYVFIFANYFEPIVNNPIFGYGIMIMLLLVMCMLGANWKVEVRVSSKGADSKHETKEGLEPGYEDGRKGPGTTSERPSSSTSSGPTINIVLNTQDHGTIVERPSSSTSSGPVLYRKVPGVPGDREQRADPPGEVDQLLERAESLQRQQQERVQAHPPSRDPQGIVYGKVNRSRRVAVATAYGYSFHEANCSSITKDAKQSRMMTVEEALLLGKAPCQRCLQPIFDELKQLNPNNKVFDGQRKRK
ncbi:unnamed protein product [Symbiodinium natans]|uniref:CCHC-type domain-containing protein n=1 Tax=Symbiodinium natans TaxID=878477 RepID=A0A812NDQ8_9DINO|nr:unnamed protein product [Symbiodinium natans]